MEDGHREVGDQDRGDHQHAERNQVEEPGSVDFADPVNLLQVVRNLLCALVRLVVQIEADFTRGLVLNEVSARWLNCSRLKLVLFQGVDGRWEDQAVPFNACLPVISFKLHFKL